MGSKYTAQQFINAIDGSGGIITTIAERVGCEWNTAKRWIEGHSTVKRAYDDECERLVDVAESVIHSSICDERDVHTAKWYLKMKGAMRGYTQTQKTEQSGEIVIKYTGNINPDEL